MGVEPRSPYLTLKPTLFKKESMHNNYYEVVSRNLAAVPLYQIMGR